MDKQTLAALKGSIKKWEDIVVGTGTDEGPDNCPLCQLFRTRVPPCRGCPVYENTGEMYCEGSPYHNWHEIIKGDFATINEEPNPAYAADLRRFAQTELNFLRSLLPESER